MPAIESGSTPIQESSPEPSSQMKVDSSGNSSPLKEINLIPSNTMSKPGLQDLFDDNEEIDFKAIERSSETNRQSKLQGNHANGAAPPVSHYQPSSTDMTYYYKNYLPFKSIFLWLNHSPAPQKDFTMREFAFEYRSGTYHRYNSYNSSSEFKAAVIKGNPSRFEIGAVYPVPPKIRKTVSTSVMKPKMKEFVLDIDLTDYDDVRTCCSKTQICNKCWKFINIAIKIVDEALREDFGFEHLIWVFSGRRGVHCWVSDYRARTLDEQKRRSIVEYLDVLNVKSSGSKKRNMNLRKPYHPHVERSYQHINKLFVEIVLKEQDTWKDDQKAIDELARNIPDYKLTQELSNIWKKNPGRSSSDKWVDVGQTFEALKIKSFNLSDWRREILFKTMYPRLDVEVSRQMNHLLKSPFCIHPGTGNVCVPFDPSVGDFDPFSAPNLKELFEEETKLESNGVQNASSQTKMKSYVDLFDKFVKDLIQDEIRSKRVREEDNVTLDF